MERERGVVHGLEPNKREQSETQRGDNEAACLVTGTMSQSAEAMGTGEGV